MYKIEKKSFGFHLTFGGLMKKDEMESWYHESLKALEDMPKEFGVFVDMRTLRPLPTESQSVMEVGQKAYQTKGMIRSVVILDSPIITVQFKSIAKESGIYEWERYIDASTEKNWESVGLKWIEDGVDPDK